MPSKSAKQAKMMKAACHDKKIAAAHRLPQKVACEFAAADAAVKKAKRKK